MWGAGRGCRQGQGLESGCSSAKGPHRLPDPHHWTRPGPSALQTVRSTGRGHQGSWSSCVAAYPGGLIVGPWAEGL